MGFILCNGSLPLQEVLDQLYAVITPSATPVYVTGRNTPKSPYKVILWEAVLLYRGESNMLRSPLGGPQDAFEKEPNVPVDLE